MKFVKKIMLYGMLFVGVTSRAKADICTGQFSAGTQPQISIGEGYVDIQGGFAHLLTTSSAVDYKAESTCNNVMNQVITLPFFGRLVAVIPQGTVHVSGETAVGKVEVTGYASAGGKTDEFKKTFTFKPPFVSSFELGQQEEKNSVCGEQIHIEVKQTRASFETEPFSGGAARVDIKNIRLMFAEVLDPNDPNCVNRPLDVVRPIVSIDPVGAMPFESGDTIEIVSSHAHKCVDIRDQSPWPYANAQIWSCAQSDNQLFEAIKINSSTYVFRAKHSGLCLAVGGGSTTNGAMTIQYEDCFAEEAMVDLEPVGNEGAYLLKSAKSGKCLDIDSGKSHNGQLIQQWDCVGTKWQEWWVNVR